MIPSLLELERLLELAMIVAGVTDGCPDPREQMRLAMGRYVHNQHAIDTITEILDKLAGDDEPYVDVQYGDYMMMITVLSTMTQHLN